MNLLILSWSHCVETDLIHYRSWLSVYTEIISNHNCYTLNRKFSPLLAALPVTSSYAMALTPLPPSLPSCVEDQRQACRGPQELSCTWGSGLTAVPHMWDSMLNTPLVMLTFINFFDFREYFGLSCQVFVIGLKSCLWGGLTDTCLSQSVLELRHQESYGLTSVCSAPS